MLVHISTSPKVNIDNIRCFSQ